jgi:hypothetical protein
MEILLLIMIWSLIQASRVRRFLLLDSRVEMVYRKKKNNYYFIYRVGNEIACCRMKFNCDGNLLSGWWSWDGWWEEIPVCCESRNHEERLLSEWEKWIPRWWAREF